MSFLSDVHNRLLTRLDEQPVMVSHPKSIRTIDDLIHHGLRDTLHQFCPGSAVELKQHRSIGCPSLPLATHDEGPAHAMGSQDQETLHTTPFRVIVGKTLYTEPVPAECSAKKARLGKRKMLFESRDLKSNSNIEFSAFLYYRQISSRSRPRWVAAR